MAVTNRKLCYFVVWTLHDKIIDTISFDDIMGKDVKEKFIAFYKDIYLKKFFREIVD